MNVGNCPECGKLYAKSTLNMCMDCYRIEEENQAKVAEYVRDNPKSTVEVIHEATGISEKTIFRMVKSGRFVDIGSISYPCQQCGAQIHEGRICGNCNAKFLKQLRESEAKRKAGEKDKEQVERKRGTGMYTKDM